jgi:para-aminobenzoate synthetase component 2
LHRLLLIDNHDSFTWNLVQALAAAGADVEVRAADEIGLDVALDPGRWRGIVLGPGPGRPEQAGITLDVVRRGSGRIPILGVCLGLQAIAAGSGGRIVRARRVLHGKTTAILHDGAGVFSGLPSPFVATRYNSLVVDPESVPAELEVHARDEDGQVMGLRHRRHRVEGVQFHPEAVLTEHGTRLLDNWLATAGILVGSGES